MSDATFKSEDQYLWGVAVVIKINFFNACIKKINFSAMLLSTFLVASCGGEESTSASGSNVSSVSEETTVVTSPSEIINGIVVPPEPDSKVNNSNIVGIDLDKNGIRDDVDRIIAVAAGGNSNDLKIAVSIAKNYQKVLLGEIKSQADADNFMLVRECFDDLSGGGISHKEIFEATMNTKERYYKFKSVTSGFGGRFFDSATFKSECDSVLNK